MTTTVTQVAKLLVDMGPCDDNATLYINGRYAKSTGLGVTARFQRDLPDGDYNLRLVVVNSGGWAWRAKLRLVVNGTAVADIDEQGGDGPWGATREWQWQAVIREGQLVEF
jgi:hypothetical protein